MSDIYKAEVSTDTIVIEGTAPPTAIVTDPSFTPAVVARRFFWAYDLDADGNPRGAFGIRCDLHNWFLGVDTPDLYDPSFDVDALSGGESGFYIYNARYYAVYSPLPEPAAAGGTGAAFWPVITQPVGGAGVPVMLRDADIASGSSFAAGDSFSTASPSDFQSGTSFSAGGTLAITKDFGGSTLTFSTPLGDMTVDFAWLTDQGHGTAYDYTPLDTPLLAGGIAHGLAYSDSVPQNSETTRWFDFYTRKNGTITSGAALSAADPINWNASLRTGIRGVSFNAPEEDISSRYWTDASTGNPYVPEDNAQETTRYRTRCLATAGTIDAGALYTLRASYGQPGLDLAEMPEHNIAWGAWTPPACNCVNVRRSNDSGQTWTETVAVSGTFTSPSLAISGGVVYLAYYDPALPGTLLTLSHDEGNTWSTPVSISIAGSNPRLVMAESVMFFFSISGGNIVLQRSMDMGSTLFDGSPITVASSVPAQDFGAVFAADRTVLVAYADSLGNWVTRISYDFGLSWSTV